MHDFSYGQGTFFLNKKIETKCENITENNITDICGIVSCVIEGMMVARGLNIYLHLVLIQLVSFIIHCII